ncbi:hypothetical protein Pfo_027768, partial [Paulownia fortunei]
MQKKVKWTLFSHPLLHTKTSFFLSQYAFFFLFHFTLLLLCERHTLNASEEGRLCSEKERERRGKSITHLHQLHSILKGDFFSAIFFLQLHLLQKHY